MESCAVVVAAVSLALVGQGCRGLGGLLWREPCMARLSQRDAVGLAALACHLRLSRCKQTFSLDGNMPEIAPPQIVFI